MVQVKFSASVRWVLGLALLASLSACSGNSALEGRFAADPSLNGSPTATGTPLTGNDLEGVIPTEIPRYPQAELLADRSSGSADRGSLRWSSADPVNLIEQYYQDRLNEQQWQIEQPFSQSGNPQPLIARKGDLSLKVEVATTGGTTEFTTDYLREGAIATPSPTPAPSPVVNTATANLDKVPDPLRPYIQDLVALGIISPDTAFNSPITRQEFAKWLVTANNQFFSGSPGKQVRLASTDSQPAFKDVPSSNPAFPEIQGLAEAGLIPSPLTGDTGAALFRPSGLLTREVLIDWKVRLDLRKPPPGATLDSLKETWGFQDAPKIDPNVLRSLYADYQNSDRANIRRVFGLTTLFQPKKPVTHAEAAAAIWYFGSQGDGLSAADAREIQAQPSPSGTPAPSQTAPQAPTAPQ